MSHPTKEQVDKAVKLWRCRDACKQTCRFPDTCVFAKHEDGFKVGQYANCHVAEIVGFRLPPRCEDCEHRDDPVCGGYGHYTPRQPGKEGK